MADTKKEAKRQLTLEDDGEIFVSENFVMFMLEEDGVRVVSNTCATGLEKLFIVKGLAKVLMSYINDITEEGEEDVAGSTKES